MRRSPHPVTLRQLQYVVAVADRRSFRRAAADCHVSQPSLSAQIALVEDLLAVRLFERDPRSVSLTAAGEAFVAEARDLLLGADALFERARTLADPLKGSLRLGIIPTVGPYLLAHAAPRLRAELPGLAVRWHEEKTPLLVQQLERGELDGAILALEAELPELPHAVIGKDPFVLGVGDGHPLARASGAVKPSELADEPVLVLDDGHCFRDQVLSFCARSGAEQASVRATSLPTLVQMAAAGGLTVLPRIAVAIENRHAALRIRPFAPKPPARTIALVWRRRSALEPALAAAARSLRQSFAELSAG
jgi:LysR family hydrogen peroxide-inducible transcriptional activator